MVLSVSQYYKSVTECEVMLLIGSECYWMVLSVIGLYEFVLVSISEW